jgi:hypothetical protein
MGSTATAQEVVNSISATLDSILTTHTDYAAKKVANTTTLQQNDSIQTTISDLDLQIRELNRQEEALNKQFLDARKNLQPVGAFARLGLSTMQDWTLAAFFFMFGVFGLILTGFLASASIYWGRVVIFGIIMTILLMAGSALLIRVMG